MEIAVFAYLARIRIFRILSARVFDRQALIRFVLAKSASWANRNPENPANPVNPDSDKDAQPPRPRPLIAMSAGMAKIKAYPQGNRILLSEPEYRSEILQVPGPLSSA